MPNPKSLRRPTRVLGKSYEPEKFEAEHYQFWEESGCFEAQDTSARNQDAYCIMIPPPNVTGVLHMGHALTNTIQDILIRWRRMKGDNTLWQPGMDHAGIATQSVVERELAKENLTRHDLGREAFIERVWKWKEEHGGLIKKQKRKLGASFDWRRERFTMDDGYVRAVREVFVRLYNEGLIYRGERIINWDPKAQTALSDLEVVPTERKANLWHIRYIVVDENGEDLKTNDETDALVVATTRPETLLGDSAVAVHPEDKRYKKYHGKRVRLPVLGRLLPIIADEYVDQEFGTGALKVTPAHDFNDYEIGVRHDLPIVSVMGKDGRISAAGGPFVGLEFVEAREKLVLQLKEEGLLVKTEEHSHKVGLSQRTGVVAEPIVSKQWFVKAKPLADPAIEAVKSGRVSFVPKNWEKTYFEWMYNIRDWCISRQLWWGHQIPAWYCSNCQSVTVAVEMPSQCGQCHADARHLKQDEDVLDTWFSSALWPFATLGWPDKTKALRTFYPTSVLETGFDIIFFWVARMIMMGLHFMKEVPFRKVYIHAMVRDERGQKMSKSKGNVIDPLEVMSQDGADPLRFTFAIMAGQGRDIKLSLDRVHGYRAFCNKLWNAVKFLHFAWEANKEDLPKRPKNGLEAWVIAHRSELSPVNRWILSSLNELVARVEESLNRFELNVAAQSIYDFAWYQLCDWYIEMSKLPLSGSGKARQDTLMVLHYSLEKILRLTHPFMPFMTEELWLSLPWREVGRRLASGTAIETIMSQTYPHAETKFQDRPAEKEVEALKNVIDTVRNFRGENNISPGKRFAVYYRGLNESANDFLNAHGKEILSLARVSELSEGDAGGGEDVAVMPLTNPAVELCVNLGSLVDREGETKRLRKEIERLGRDLARVEAKLENENFLERAPATVVEKEKHRRGELQGLMKEHERSLDRLSRRSQ